MRVAREGAAVRSFSGCPAGRFGARTEAEGGAALGTTGVGIATCAGAATGATISAATVGGGAASAVLAGGAASSVAPTGLDAVASLPVDTHFGVTTSAAKPSTAAETTPSAARTRCPRATLVKLTVSDAVTGPRAAGRTSSTMGTDEREGAGTEGAGRLVAGSSLSAKGMSAATSSGTLW